jgi:hypothetical protein
LDGESSNKSYTLLSNSLVKKSIPYKIIPPKNWPQILLNNFNLMFFLSSNLIVKILPLKINKVSGILITLSTYKIWYSYQLN